MPIVDWVFPILLVGSGLVLASILTSALAFRFGAPLLLVFLGIGLLAGEDGLGIRYDDVQSAYFLGSAALAVILFDSGFGTRLRTFRQAAAPAITLATIGVGLTAGFVGLAAWSLLGLPLLEALLLGAIIGSTDAAAVFFLLRVGGITIRENVRSVLEVESGSNDPMAIFLTITLAELILAGGGVADITVGFVTGFALQMGLGLALGLAGGYAIVFLANRIEVEGALNTIAVLAAALSIFAATGAAGGSGFLAVYVAGLVAGNSSMAGVAGLRRFLEGVTWLAQITMFLMLGLLATPSGFALVALPAAAIALVLTFIARPLAVWICLLPFGFARAETAFMSWVGLRGAVSILLAIIPLLAGLENGQLLFNSAYIIVLASLLLQGWTIRPMAKLLGLIVPPRIGPVQRVELELPGAAHHELVGYKVVKDSPVERGDRLPRWARPSLVVREGKSMRYQYAGRLREADYVYMFIGPRYTRLLDRLFASPRKVESDDKEFYGDFTVDPTKPVRALSETYGLDGVPDASDLSLADFVVKRLGGTAEIGDRVGLGSVDLIVRDVDANGAVSELGLAIGAEETRPRIPLFMSGQEILGKLRGRGRKRD